MIKKTLPLALFICLFLALLSPSPVKAQDKLEILDSAAQVDFPAELSFSVSARSDVNITDIRLRYTVDRASFAEVTSEVDIEFTPGTAVDANWTLEMVRVGGLPPGSSVEYWWVVKDASGDRVETSPVQTRFSDNRYPWRRLTEGKVTIYWYDGDEAFARELMAASQQALERLAADTGASLNEPVSMYIYASTQDLQGAMIFPQEWTGGVAFTRFDTIVIGISPSNVIWGKQAITHELTHLVIHQMTFNPYGDLPTWLNEGLAMYAEGILGPEYTGRLYKAVTEDSLISVRSLSSPFSAYAEEATLSYAESYSVVGFLIHEYGQAKMLELLNTFQRGNSYDDALTSVYGFNMDGLNTLWRADVSRQYQPAAVEEKGTHPALTAIIAALATGFLLVLVLSAESWAWRRGW